MNIPRASIWPTVTFNTTRPDGMAEARAWVASLFDGEAAQCPQEPRNGSNSTSGPDEANRTPCGSCDGRGWICYHCGPRADWHHAMDCAPGSEVPCPNCSQRRDVVSTLLEAAQAAKGTLPPPKPGTQATEHCTHWTEAGEQCCQCNRIIPDEQWAARTCPPVNNHATQEIDLEPVIGLEFDYLGRKSTQEAK